MDEPSLQHPAVKVFASNLPNDNLLFVTNGSNIKVMSVVSAMEILNIKSVHFKGTYNLG
jgi:hypothetical protein